MAYQAVFARYEMKYLITPAQKALVLEAMAPYLALDQYGRTTIRNLYCDTKDYRLARRSIEQPVYKEKLRLRSYGPAEPGSPVFVELKKKYESVTYKRRLSMPEKQAMDWVCGGPCGTRTQIAEEIGYVLSYYRTLRPVVFLSYEREAYSGSDEGFRVTFDENILCRREDLSLGSEVWGEALLPEGKVLMEIKTAGGIPLWMTRVLSREHIYRTSFSKYGTAYRTMLFPYHTQLEGDNIYA